MHSSTLEIQVQSTGRDLHTTVYDQNAGRIASYHIKHSSHSQQRAAQRGIGDELIPLVLEFGKVFLKQGMRFYAVTQKHLPKIIDHKIRAKLNNMVVVMSGDTNTIITCYKADNAIRHINRKACFISS